MAKKLTIEVTQDEADALEAVRPYAAQIAAAKRRGFRHCLGLDTYFSAHRFDVFWNPNFWYWFSEAVQDAQTDPARMVAALHAGDDDEQKLRERKSFAAVADSGRSELDRFFAALRGQHRAGRPKGTRKVDHVERKARIFRKADEIDRRSGGRERAPVKKATEALAPTIEPGRALKPETLKRSLARAGKR